MTATLDETSGEASVFLLNRDLESEREITLEWHNSMPTRVLACETLTDTDLKAKNTFKQPDRIIPRPLDAPDAGCSMTVKLPPASYSVMSLAVNGN